MFVKTFLLYGKRESKANGKQGRARNIALSYASGKIVYHYIDHEESTANRVDEVAISNRLDIQIHKLSGYMKRGFLKEYYPGIEALFCRTYYN